MPTLVGVLSLVNRAIYLGAMYSRAAKHAAIPSDTAEGTTTLMGATPGAARNGLELLVAQLNSLAFLQVR